MRNAALIIGVCAVAACSVDHVLVAALDPPNAGRSAGGESGAPDTRLSAGEGGLATAFDAAGQAGAIVSTNSAGSAGAPVENTAGAGDLGSRVFCACLSNE